MVTIPNGNKPKEPTIASFHQQYPQYSAYHHPEEASFSWLWYFAMQQMGDDQAAEDAKALKEKLRLRNKFSNIAGWFVPTIHAQLSLNALAQSDLNHHIDYWEALEAFHEEKRLYFYPRIFQNTAVADEDWDSFGLGHYQGEIQLSGLLAHMAIGSAIPLSFGTCSYGWCQASKPLKKPILISVERSLGYTIASRPLPLWCIA